MSRWIIAGLLLVVLVGGVRWGLSAWRRYLISRCPIAYVGVDEHIHLTNPEGTIDIEMEGPTVDASYEPTWSPSGSMLAYAHSTSDEIRSIIVLEPDVGELWEHACHEDGEFAGWLDEQTFFETHVGARDARTGRIVRELPSISLGQIVTDVCTVPGRNTSELCIAGRGIRLNRKDELFEDRESAGLFVQFRWLVSDHRAQTPRVDSEGRWVGWTQRLRRGDDVYGSDAIAIKPLAPNSDNPWIWLGGQFSAAVFCDWTASGNILAHVRQHFSLSQWWERDWRLVIMDKDGTLIGDVPTDVPLDIRTRAGWRKNMLGGK